MIKILKRRIPHALATAGILCFLPPGAEAKKIPAAFLETKSYFFSPNKDGVQDDISFRLKIEHVKKISAWEIRFEDASQTPRRTVSGSGEIPPELSWSGMDDFNAPCPEGGYQAVFRVWNEKKQMLAAAPVKIALDLTPPVLSVRSEGRRVILRDALFSPVTFYFSTQDLSGIAGWKIELIDKTKQTLYSESSTAPLPSTWVLSDDMARMPAGKANVILSATDGSGNKNSSPPLEIDFEEPGGRAEPASRPEPASDGPYLQMTAIVSIGDLFGPGADGQSQLSREAPALLEPLANSILGAPGARAIILGHVDSQENQQKSKSLSSYFAWRVFSYLVKEKSIEKSRISVKGLGADLPISDNRTPLGRSRNRRIEIQIFYPARSAAE